MKSWDECAKQNRESSLRLKTLGEKQQVERRMIADAVETCGKNALICETPIEKHKTSGEYSIR
jgi:hypothetical protein